ncbi:NAD-dependent succinate-semialdehyde dehydrogenase [Mycobacterium sp. Root135]|uniref:aldehyde dehydrogenase family protein n=1 Tax=Mycobacterium sp. Root135 TaxID=1736457 RepID=UPI0006F9CCE3|nr:aldehyde dehydrogenase family protein [Mycobacterium sp. Root135]KQY07828.1 NAD-dependent succinate-semialdehyde dehydrogenase [Mycobacterium sp. Root135]
MSNHTDDYPEIASFIDGVWTRGSGDQQIAVLNPATGEQLGVVPVAAPSDIASALDAADAAFAHWRNVSPLVRSDTLRRAAALLRQRSATVAGLVTSELGKPTAEARQEVITAAEHIEWAAEEGRRGYGRTIPARAAGSMQSTRHEPLGPVAGFAPWNAPVITPARKIAYTLAAGCTLVLKPSEETPACAVALTQAFADAGVPRGVLNVVFGDPREVSAYLLGESRIKAVTFTGSTSVGRHLAVLAALSMKRLVLELGGHAPVIVTADVDVQQVAESAVGATYRNSGQVCTSPSRFLLHDSVHDEFVDAFIRRAEQLVVGDPGDERTQMGPVANEQRITAMRRFTEDARNRGVSVPIGGDRIDRPGTFWRPTLLADVTDDVLAVNVEPFGPLATTQRYQDLDQAIATANRLPVGLASYAWTNSLGDARRLLDGIDAGSVVVNQWQASLPETPFGGYGDSGIGTEGGIEGLAAFQRIKYTALA